MCSSLHHACSYSRLHLSYAHVEMHQLISQQRMQTPWWCSCFTLTSWGWWRYLGAISPAQSPTILIFQMLKGTLAFSYVFLRSKRQISRSWLLSFTDFTCFCFVKDLPRYFWILVSCLRARKWVEKLGSFQVFPGLVSFFHKLLRVIVAFLGNPFCFINIGVFPRILLGKFYKFFKLAYACST